MQAGTKITVQRSDARVFLSSEYERAGAVITDSIDGCRVIIGLKEMDPGAVDDEKTYALFSHTLKGQQQNMALLQRFLNSRATLIDYERIADESGRRLVYFGRFAGLAGMINTLWGTGRRLADRGIETPLAALQLAYQYGSLATASQALRQIGVRIRADGVGGPGCLKIGIAGTGNTARGAEEVLRLIGAHYVAPENLGAVKNGIYYTLFDLKHLVADRNGHVDPRRYFEDPDGYHSIFASFASDLDVLVNCIYWEKRYPRLLTCDELVQLCGPKEHSSLLVIGDIACDLGGAIEATVKCTTWDQPFFVYDIENRCAVDGLFAPGPAIMSIYNLPAQLPRESSAAFGDMLAPFARELAAADWSQPVDKVGVSAALQRAILVHRGSLTPSFRYLEQALSRKTG